MRLSRLYIQDWRNLGRVQLDLGPARVVLWGENGAGKTNLLEAIGALATLRSFRNAAWTDVVRWEAPQAVVSGQVDGDMGLARLRFQVQASRREAFLEGAPVHDSARYFKHLRAVVFTPSDTGIVRGEPDARRRFLDRAAFNAWPAHLAAVREFRRALDQKSVLLRSGVSRKAEVEAWNQRLSHAGAQVSHGRARVVDALQDPLARIHGILAEGRGASLTYRSALGRGTPQELEARYLDLLERRLDDELQRGTHLVGPQRDELDLRLEAEGSSDLATPPERPSPRWCLARTFGSQGQVRTLALALKLAELEVARSMGDPPLLLLDDLSSELDDKRLGGLLRALDGLDAQVFMTTTNPSPILENSRIDVQAVHLREGGVAGGGPEG